MTSHPFRPTAASASASKTGQSPTATMSAPADSTASTAHALHSLTGFCDDLKNHLTCTICFRLLYQPYTSSCGHTHCYSCLTSWFTNNDNRTRKPTCPDCRAAITTPPAPAVLVRSLVSSIIQRPELLGEDETLQQHAQMLLDEAKLVEADRPNLFQGCFKHHFRSIPSPLRDAADGVERCPLCHWELEHGECGQCNYPNHEADSDYDSWSDSEQTMHHPMHTGRLRALMGAVDVDDVEDDYISLNGLSDDFEGNSDDMGPPRFQGSQAGDDEADSDDFDSDESDSGSMQDFIEPDQTLASNQYEESHSGDETYEDAEDSVEEETPNVPQFALTYGDSDDESDSHPESEGSGESDASPAPYEDTPPLLARRRRPPPVLIESSDDEADDSTRHSITDGDDTSVAQGDDEANEDASEDSDDEMPVSQASRSAQFCPLSQKADPSLTMSQKTMALTGSSTQLAPTLVSPVADTTLMCLVEGFETAAAMGWGVYLWITVLLLIHTCS